MSVPRPSLRQEQRDLTRRRIMDAAQACFYERGVADTSVEQIARAAGVGRATLYLHFPNQDAILLDLLLSNLRAVRGIFRDLFALEPFVRGQKPVWLAGLFRKLREHRESIRPV